MMALYSGRSLRQSRVHAHRFQASCVNMVGDRPYWRDVGTIDAYWEANLDLTRIVPELNLYDEAWPMLGRQPHRPPAKFVFDDADRRGVAMDSLIHYRAHDVVAALSRLAERTRQSIVFTAAPRTPATMAMLTMGKLFPRGDRSPAIEPIAPAELRRLMAVDPSLAAWRTGRFELISCGFYKSQALEWSKAGS